MKKILYLCSILLLAGCNNSNKTADEMSSSQVKPQCQLTESEPCISSACIKVHAVCSGGTVPIVEAYITLDTQHKSVAFEGNNLDTFITFGNLQPRSTYKSELTVIVDGETIQESLMVSTRDIEIVCKNSLDLHIRSLNLPSDGTILDLNSLCSSSGMISYKIKSVSFTEGAALSSNGQLTTQNFNLLAELNIERGKLKLSSIPYGGGSGIVVIQAVALGVARNITINLSLESLQLP
jgi:hypothetical protein